MSDRSARFGARQVLTQEEVVDVDGSRRTMTVMSKDFSWTSLEELVKRVDSVARGFMSIGVSPGEEVLVFAETRLEWLLVAHSVWRMAAVIATSQAVPFSMNMIRESGAKVLVTTADRLALLKQACLPDCLTTIVFFEGHTQAHVHGFPPHVQLLSLASLQDMGCSQEAQPSSPQATDKAVHLLASHGHGVWLTHADLMATSGGSGSECARDDQTRGE